MGDRGGDESDSPGIGRQPSRSAAREAQRPRNLAIRWRWRSGVMVAVCVSVAFAMGWLLWAKPPPSEPLRPARQPPMLIDGCNERELAGLRAVDHADSNEWVDLT